MLGVATAGSINEGFESFGFEDAGGEGFPRRISDFLDCVGVLVEFCRDFAVDGSAAVVARRRAGAVVVHTEVHLFGEKLYREHVEAEICA